MAVPYTFGSATTSIPLSQLDSNFATTITLGNTAIQLGNTVTTLNNMTLANATVSATNVTATNITSPLSTALTLQSNAGNTAVTIDTSQNVGIGVTSPAYKLDILGGNTPVQIASNDAAASIGLTLKYNTSTIYGYIGNGSSVLSGAASSDFVMRSQGALAFATNGNNRQATIDTSGNVGIGTSSPGSYGAGYKTLTVQGSTQGIIQATDGTTTSELSHTGGIGYVGTRSNSAFGFFTNNTEAMRITTGQSLCVGTTSSLASARVSIKTPDSSGALIPLSLTVGLVSDGFGGISFRNPNGAQGSVSINSTSVSYNTTSDYRLKENVQPMTGALAKVAQLKPVTYQWKINGKDSEGFIAHELSEVCPHAVTGEKDATRQEEYEVTPAVKDEAGNITTPAEMGTRTVPSYQGIDTSFLVATLTAAIQELKAIVDAQATEIEALKAKVGA